MSKPPTDGSPARAKAASADAMPAASTGAAAREGPPPRDVRVAAKHTEQDPSQTVACRGSRGRRGAPRRLDPMGDSGRDPFDLAATGARMVRWGGYDVTDLGLTCAHGRNCPARRRAVA